MDGRVVAMIISRDEIRMFSSRLTNPDDNPLFDHCKNIDYPSDIFSNDFV